MRLLVTGGLGFIGSGFIEWILQNKAGVHITNVDKCDYMAREYNVAPHPRYLYIRADITEANRMRQIFEKTQPEVVVHFAAQSCVTRSFGLAFQYTKDNVLGTQVLLETARCYGRLRKFVHFSTDEVYGDVGLGVVCDATAPLNPSNPYSASKAAAELYVRAYGNAYGVPIIITRGNNTYGPRQYPEKLIPLFVTQILEGVPCTVHGKGDTRRNFIYVDDVSRAVATIIDRGQIGKVYNIGTSFEFSVMEIYDKLRAIFTDLGVAPSFQFVSDPRPFNDSRYAIDSSALRELGWSEDTPFDDGLRKTVDWYRTHRDYWGEAHGS
jgi:UDP-glucose 4,6-dehydratase